MRSNITIFRFDPEKDAWLKRSRGLSFSEVVPIIQSGNIIDITPHHNKNKFPNQLVYIIEIRGYVYVVPFVKEDDTTVFLKTIIPSRKHLKKYGAKR